MEWMFLITAHNRVRVESRILQVLDHHLISLQSFASMRVGAELRVNFIAEIDQAGAIRTADLLRRLQDVQCVDLFANQEGLCRTLALFKVLCDQDSRLPLLQVISSLGATVVAVRPEWVAFQIVGTLEDIQGLHASLLPYGLVEAMSVASAVVRKESGIENLQSIPLPEVAVPAILKPSRKQQRIAI